jgi:hypothetical protein
MNETGQTQQKGNLNAPLCNLNVPPPRPHRNLPELSLAKRANTREMKHYLFVVCEGIGGGISKQYPGGGFNAEEWMTECGVLSEWATIAA